MENTIDQLLTKLNACREAQDWAKGKTFVEVYNTCYRGDWLCWLFSRTNPEDIQLLTLVKGYQANTVRHLMTDKRSLKAIDTAISFGEGRATSKELGKAADAADDVAAGSYIAEAAVRTASASADASYSGYAAFSAAVASARAARAAADAASYAAEHAARDAIYAAAEQANEQLTADIFRKYISIDKFNI